MADADVAAAAGLLSDLVAIDSQNPSLASGRGGERAIAQFCVEWLLARGVEAWVDEVAADRCNAVARVSGGAGLTVALCAHLDTVAVADAPDASLTPRTDGDRLFGRGAYDMKGSVAAILMALAELSRQPPTGTVVAALVADEEFASMGAADFVRRYPVDACIVTEPSEGALILAHKGFVWVEVETAGVAAHGSRWEEGRSAVGAMARIAAALEAYDAGVLRQRVHPLAGPASLHCAMISGGTGWSTYSDRCTLRVERRTLPGETPQQVLDEVAAVIEAAGERATLREVLSRSPLECAADSAVANAVRAAVAESSGTVPPDGGVAYWMDAAIFADAGATTVNYGPSGGGAHAATEWVDLRSVVHCRDVLVGAARHYCAPQGGAVAHPDHEPGEHA